MPSHEFVAFLDSLSVSNLKQNRKKNGSRAVAFPVSRQRSPPPPAAAAAASAPRACILLASCWNLLGHIASCRRYTCSFCSSNATMMMMQMTYYSSADVTLLLDSWKTNGDPSYFAICTRTRSCTIPLWLILIAFPQRSLQSSLFPTSTNHSPFTSASSEALLLYALRHLLSHPAPLTLTSAVGNI